MNNEGILTALVSNFHANETLLSNVKDETAKKEIFKEICEQVYCKYEEETVSNLRLIINYLSNFSDIEEIITEINSRINNKSLIQSKKREEENGFDAKYGTTTKSVVEQFEMQESITLERFMNSTRYYPSPIASVRAALEHIKIYIGAYENYIFVDIGSGMGRNLLLASEYPFQKIIGIEIAPYLHNIAQSNLSIYQSMTQQCKKFELLCIDALNFSFPSENMVMYFWEPFPEIISNTFVAQLLEFVRGQKNDVFLIFLQGVFPAIKNSDAFKMINSFKTDDLASKEAGYFEISIFKVVIDG